jgi:glutaconyl-CoA/methylmalonyl-CoA decarboxylase subunit gamma
MKRLRITFEGKAYELLVEVLDAGTADLPSPSTAVAGPATPPTAGRAVPAEPATRPAPAPAAALPSAPSPAAGAGVVASPLAGKIVSVDVAVGQTVADGTKLATIEAMKMITVVYADRPGKVVAVLVQAGDNVDADAPLLWLA